ncbi:MAG TPA: tetratricopeptide repeat protein, partial [Gemmatimonadaceae bacterium]|nr:tetratricopeptide repeat protein [Gemmatimonadaceae bacterium]
LSRFASAYPSDSAFVDLGRAYMLVGRLDSAAMVLKSAIALNPDRTDADEFLGGMLAEQGRAAEAIALLERAAQGGRRSPVLFGLMSLAYAEGGRHADAVEAARAAASAGSTDANVYVLAGRAMLAAGEPSLAQSYLSRALQLSPSNRDAAAALRAIQGGPSDKRD